MEQHPATRTIVLDTIDCALIEVGAGGRPLLLVHGYTGAKEDFVDHVDALAEQGWWVVAPDLRGHGGSSKPDDPGEYSLDHFRDDLIALVDALDWERFTLLGHSMGGMIAQVLALAHEHRLDGLVLMDTGHGPVTSIDAETATMGADLAASGGMAAVKEVLDAMGEDAPLGNAAFERVCRERDGYRDWCDRKFLATSAAMYGSMLQQLVAAEDRLEALAQLSVPTHVVVGELDADFIEPSRRLAETIPGASHHLLPDGGHSPQFEAPVAWRESITGFLRTVHAAG